MDEKIIRTIAIVILIVGCGVGGFFLGKGRGNKALREAVTISDKLTKTVSELDTDIKFARSEIERLGEVKLKDAATIESLRKSNNSVIGIAEEQGRLLRELRAGSGILGEQSSGIEFGLSTTAKEIEKIITILKAENN